MKSSQQVVFDIIENNADSVLALTADVSDFVIIFPLRGTQKLQRSGKWFEPDRGCAVVLSPTRSHRLELSTSSQVQRVRISRSAIEKELAELIGYALPQPLVFDDLMDTRGDQAASWLRTLKHIEEEEQCNWSLFSDDAFLKCFEKTIVCGLLFCHSHNYSIELQISKSKLAPAYVQRAEAFIRKNAHESISSLDIVAASGVKRRTLYHGFRRYLETSPVNYMRTVRFHRARHDLRDGRQDQSVTHIAMQWGFNHLGRFSSEYKAMFGEYPSATQRRKDVNKQYLNNEHLKSQDLHNFLNNNVQQCA